MFLIFTLFVKNDVLAKETKNDLPKILVVIDRSLSLQEEDVSIRQALEMLYSFIETKGMEDTVDIIVFAEDAKYAKLSNWKEISVNGNYTDIIKALELADEWVQERRDANERGYVIVVSDLLSDLSGNFSMNDAENIQNKINEVLKNWDGYRKEELDYLFITWKNIADKQYKKLNEYKDDEIEEIDKFYCNIVKKSKVTYLDVKSDAESGKAVSDVSLTGQMLKKIFEGWTGVKIKEGELFGDRAEIEINNYHEAYVLMDKNGKLLMEEEPICFTEDMQIYELKAGSNNRSMKVSMPENVIDQKIYYFYIPTTDGTLALTPVDRTVAEFLYFKYTQKSDYVYKTLSTPLNMYIYQEDGEEKTLILKKEMDLVDKGEYQSKIMIEEAGDYLCEIRTADNQIILREKAFKVEEPRIVDPDIDINDKNEIQVDGVWC